MSFPFLWSFVLPFIPPFNWVFRCTSSTFVPTLCHSVKLPKMYWCSKMAETCENFKLTDRLDQPTTPRLARYRAGECNGNESCSVPCPPPPPSSALSVRVGAFVSLVKNFTAALSLRAALMWPLVLFSLLRPPSGLGKQKGNAERIFSPKVTQTQSVANKFA